MLEDDVLFLQAASTMGKEGLKALAADYVSKGAYVEAAKATFALSELSGSSDGGVCAPLLKRALELLEQSGPLTTRESQQLQWDVLSRYQWILSIERDSTGGNSELSRIEALQEKARTNPAIRQDPLALYLAGLSQSIFLFGNMPFAWEGGRVVTNEVIHQALVLQRGKWLPFLKLARDQTVGSRREFHDCFKSIYLHIVGGEVGCHGTKANAQFMHRFSDEEWGSDNREFVQSICKQDFHRHHGIARKAALSYQ